MKFNFINYSKVKVSAKTTTSGNLPPFKSITLRGAFGSNLRKTVCVNMRKDCSDCIVAKSCAYSYIFDGLISGETHFMKLYDNAPQPMVIETPFKTGEKWAIGDDFEFELLLLGKTIEYFPYIAYTILEMGKLGIGKDRIEFEVVSMQDFTGRKLYSNKANDITKPLTQELFWGETENSTSNLRITFETPLRIRKEGKDSYAPTFKDIMLSTLRRFEILAYFYGNKESVPLFRRLAHNCPNLPCNFATEPVSIGRYSCRQKARMHLRGIIGSATFEDVPAEYTELLNLAQILHIGKNTSFGFGKIKVQTE
ncbi:MAG: CRISPR system precrRNA processing endoribonuclease RAMP protein Cas6 [Phycisphaerae bacterium]